MEKKLKTLEHSKDLSNRIYKTQHCWFWLGCCDRDGYGVLRIKKKNYRAHRYFYEKEKGFIEEKKQLDHLCSMRNCVNPEHLQPVTNAENWLRGNSPSRLAKDRTHCKSGHKLVVVQSNGKRGCKICRNSRRRK